MTMGSIDGHARAELQNLKHHLEFLEQAQAEIGSHRTQFSEELNQRILVLEQNQLRLLRIFEAFAAQALTLGLVPQENLEIVTRSAALPEEDSHILTPFLQSCGFQETPQQTSMYSSLSRLAEDVALPPEEFLQILESEVKDDAPSGSLGD